MKVFRFCMFILLALLLLCLDLLIFYHPPSLLEFVDTLPVPPSLLSLGVILFVLPSLLRFGVLILFVLLLLLMSIGYRNLRILLSFFAIIVYLKTGNLLPAFPTLLWKDKNFFINFGMMSLLAFYAAIWWRQIATFIVKFFIPDDRDEIERNNVNNWICGEARSLTVGFYCLAFFSLFSIDIPEFVIILPNEKAFLVPGDDAYNDCTTSSTFSDDRSLVRRFPIPHVKRASSGSWWGRDVYIPSCRPVIVDFTPVSREWGAPDKKDGFHCQSVEGLNVTVGVSLVAHVRDVGKYLRIFGTSPPIADHAKAVGATTSVYYGRKLKEVMEDFGRKKVAEVLCNEIVDRNFQRIHWETEIITGKIRNTLYEHFASCGIAIDSFGYLENFIVDDEIQKAVNQLYVAEQDLEIVKKLYPYTETLKALATAHALQKFGDKTDGKLPTTILGIQPGANGMMNMLFGSGGKTDGVMPENK